MKSSFSFYPISTFDSFNNYGIYQPTQTYLDAISQYVETRDISKISFFIENAKESYFPDAIFLQQHNLFKILFSSLCTCCSRDLVVHYLMIFYYFSFHLTSDHPFFSEKFILKILSIYEHSSYSFPSYILQNIIVYQKNNSSFFSFLSKVGFFEIMILKIESLTSFHEKSEFLTLLEISLFSFHVFVPNSLLYFFRILPTLFSFFSVHVQSKKQFFVCFSVLVKESALLPLFIKNDFENILINSIRDYDSDSFDSIFLCFSVLHDHNLLHKYDIIFPLLIKILNSSSFSMPSLFQFLEKTWEKFSNLSELIDAVFSRVSCGNFTLSFYSIQFLLFLFDKYPFSFKMIPLSDMAENLLSLFTVFDEAYQKIVLNFFLYLQKEEKELFAGYECEINEIMSQIRR